jgi:hypothetical protein
LAKRNAGQKCTSTESNRKRKRFCMQSCTQQISGPKNGFSALLEIISVANRANFHTSKAAVHITHHANCQSHVGPHSQIARVCINCTIEFIGVRADSAL